MNIDDKKHEELQIENIEKANNISDESKEEIKESNISIGIPSYNPNTPEDLSNIDIRPPSILFNK